MSVLIPRILLSLVRTKVLLENYDLSPPKSVFAEDNLQYVTFHFKLDDRGSSGTSVTAGGPIFYWIEQGVIWSSTMTAGMSANMNVFYSINNADSQSQCFVIDVSPFYQ
jgi:hypothetical protein